MRTFCVKYSFLNSETKRLDASYHINDTVEYRSRLAVCPHAVTTIGKEASKVFYGNIFSRIYVKDAAHGIPYLSASEMQKSDLNTGKYLSKKQAEHLKYLMLDKDWILISCSGTLGICVYTDERYSKMIGTHDLIRLIPRKDQIYPGVIYAFLASRFGYAMLTHSQYGSVVQHTNSDQVKAIPIPVFPDALQKKVHSLVMESARLREEADSAYQKAIQIIETEIPMPLTGYKTSSVGLNKILYSQNKRLDANYHICAGDTYQTYIKENFEYKTLGELAKNFWRPDIFKRHYVQQGIMFLGSSNIMLATPESKKYLSKKQTDISLLKVDENWILIPRSGTIGDCVLTNSQHAQKLVSEHVIRFESNNILSVEYIFAFLSSYIGKQLIKKHMFGSVIQHVEPPLLSTIPIPVLDQKIQVNITELVEEYRKKMGVSSAKQKEAISDIEEEIEKWQK